MATPAVMPRSGDTIDLKAGPQVFALKYATGKNVTSKFPGGRVMFTCVDDRKLFLNDEEASEFEHALLDQRVSVADFIRVERITHGRGGGFSIRVTRIPDPDESDAREPETARRETRTEALLEKSIEMARETRRTPGSREAAPVPVQAATRSIHNTTTQEMTNGNDTARLPNGPTETPVVITPAAVAMCAAMCAAVDAVLETQAYATRRGLGVTFSEESVRAIGLSIYIGAQRGGR